jgi:putative membrane protein
VGGKTQWEPILFGGLKPPMKFRAYLSRPALIAAVLFSCSANAQTNLRPENSLKAVDRNFIEQAARAGWEELAIARIAVERTANPHVRDYAEMIVSEQENATDAIAALAASKTIALPARDSDADRWAKRDAKGFDQEYLRKAVSDHEDTVKLFEKEAREGEDPDAVAFARKTLPRLLHHLQLGKDLQKLTK